MCSLGAHSVRCQYLSLCVRRAALRAFTVACRSLVIGSGTAFSTVDCTLFRRTQVRACDRQEQSPPACLARTVAKPAAAPQPRQSERVPYSCSRRPAVPTISALHYPLDVAPHATVRAPRGQHASYDAVCTTNERVQNRRSVVRSAAVAYHHRAWHESRIVGG